MFYAAAVVASILALSTGSADAFQGRTGRIVSRAVRMSVEDPWFPSSLTSNVVTLEALGYRLIV